MAERLYGIGDIGATHTRVAVFDSMGHTYGLRAYETNREDYAGSIQEVADVIEVETRTHKAAPQSAENSELVAVSVAIAAEVGADGILQRSGALTPWVGRPFSSDLAAALDLPPERVGSPNDAEALAISQAHVNDQNGHMLDGMALTLSSGWGGARYTAEGETKPDEPGHEYLRSGAVCPCGEEGHAEAFISGEGIMQNQGYPMASWLRNRSNRALMILDLTDATMNLLGRHQADGFVIQELRWGGGIALNQPFLLREVANRLNGEFGPEIVPAFDTLTMGRHAGLHGTLVDAQRLAEAA